MFTRMLSVVSRSLEPELLVPAGLPCYLAHGLDVVATDPAPNAEANLREYIDNAWPALEQLGLSAGASKERLSFTTRLNEALEGVDLVQENGPEKPDFKIKLFAEMDGLTPADYYSCLQFVGHPHWR